MAIGLRSATRPGSPGEVMEEGEAGPVLWIFIVSSCVLVRRQPRGRAAPCSADSRAIACRSSAAAPCGSPRMRRVLTAAGVGGRRSLVLDDGADRATASSGRPSRGVEQRESRIRRRCRPGKSRDLAPERRLGLGGAAEPGQHVAAHQVESGELLRRAPSAWPRPAARSASSSFSALHLECSPSSSAARAASRGP